MHAAAINFRGGVSPRGTLLRGQSIIEYVLIIAVIGLVIVFAGPGVAGAIRNQFNLVGNTVNSGTTGGVEGGASGGGSTGAASATVQEAVVKDAKDWTLDEQKAVAGDIAGKGEASPAYAKAKAAMDAGTKFSMKLTDGQTMTYRIIGINHDDLADGSGKAGLTFLTTSTGIVSRMNATNTNVGGWEKSELRQKMNSGEIWNLMPSEFQSKVKEVTKFTNNVGGGKKNIDVSSTSDKLFLLSPTEIWGGKSYGVNQEEGCQYEYYACKGVTKQNYSGASNGWGHRERSPWITLEGEDTERFSGVDYDGDSWPYDANQDVNVFSAFCF